MKSNIFHPEPQPLKGLHPTTHSFVSFAQNAMKKFVARLWVTGIVAVVILIQLTWILLVMTANDIRHFSHVTTFLFPVLFVVGIVIHFRKK